jgi:hypothetical protein
MLSYTKIKNQVLVLAGIKRLGLNTNDITNMAAILLHDHKKLDQK